MVRATIGKLLRMKEISSFVIRLTGKAELPLGIDIGHNYRTTLEGSITQQTDTDNDDGSLTRIYTFRPIKVEVMSPLGETIKAKDTRRNSELIRSLIRKKWYDAASNLDPEEFYTKVCASIMMNIDKIIDWSNV